LLTPVPPPAAPHDRPPPRLMGLIGVRPSVSHLPHAPLALSPAAVGCSTMVEKDVPAQPHSIRPAKRPRIGLVHERILRGGCCHIQLLLLIITAPAAAHITPLLNAAAAIYNGTGVKWYACRRWHRQHRHL
jgi:hypothetical protein